MGQSSSSIGSISAARREAESLAASTGALPTLQKAFSLLSDPQTNGIPLITLQVEFPTVYLQMEIFFSIFLAVLVSIFTGISVDHLICSVVFLICDGIFEFFCVPPAAN